MFGVITLKFKQKTSFHTEICPKGADGMANSVDPDKTAPDLGLHCLPGPVCKKTYS